MAHGRASNQSMDTKHERKNLKFTAVDETMTDTMNGPAAKLCFFMLALSSFSGVLSGHAPKESPPLPDGVSHVLLLF